jgi:hypothetical protein
MNISRYQRKILCGKYNSDIFHVFSEARDHILILNILFFNKLRQIIPEVRSERAGYYRSSLLTGFRAEKIIYLGFVPSGGN